MKKVLIMIALVSLAGFTSVFFVFRAQPPDPIPDSVAIHFAMQTAINDDSAREVALSQAATAIIAEAFEEMDAARRSRDNALQTAIYLIICAFAIIAALLYIYCDRKILKPFRKLQGLAGRIATGNLDIPLEMDKDNLFGAFTESFDLLREELRVARENELKANQSKKELVASLSHDIKAPVASIRSGIELLLVKSGNEAEKKMLDSINTKLEQIDDLVTNMFHATLEELEVLNVTLIETLSTAIFSLIHIADYKVQVQPTSIPHCIVLADLMRLQQVFDNIISNSYKYADTAISIDAFIDEGYLVIDIKDFGAGVPEEELPLLTGKFYRGKNSENSQGYGLGLYISKFLMEQMSGGIDCENHNDGFVVRLLLKLA